MKDKIHNKYRIFKFFSSKEAYKLSFLLTVILAFYGSFVLGASQDNFIDSNFITFTFPIFNILMLFILMLNTFNILSSFDYEFSSYVIRLSNKKKYIKELLSNILLFNVLHLFIFFLLYFSMMIFLKYNFIFIHKFYFYDISNLTYLIFYLIRYVIFCLVICLIEGLIYIKFKMKGFVITNVIFVLGLLLNTFKDYVTSNFLIFPWSYFNIINYGTFSLEISFSILYLLVLEVLLYILYKILFIKHINFNTFKYLFLHDINYLISKRWKLLLIFVLLPILNVFLNINLDVSFIDILNNGLALNINKNCNVIDIVIYILNISFIIFLVTDLFIKDIKYSLSNIFLRISPFKWIINKIMGFLIISSSLIFIKYFMAVLGIIILGNKGFDNEFLKLMLTEIFYVNALGFIYLFLYFLANIRFSFKVLAIIFGIIMMIFIPKSIFFMKDYVVFIIIILIIFILLTGFLVKKNYKKIIQNI